MDGDADAASVRLGLRPRRTPVQAPAVRRPHAGASGSDVGGRPSPRIRALPGHRPPDGLPRARARLARVARAHPLREPQAGLRFPGRLAARAPSGAGVGAAVTAERDFYLSRLYPLQDRILARLASIDTGC